MKTWISSPHAISDIRTWQSQSHLEIQPDYQRREVWSNAARIMLMDTILRGIPMPKMFVSSVVKDEQVYRTVIDGQQRISAILGFLKDQFALDTPYSGEFKGKRFSQLPENVRNAFLQYRIDFNEAFEFSDEEIRETYSRLNKYSAPLTKQELRRADFPGAFLDLSEDLALAEFLEAGKIFSVGNRRRFADVEFVSELLAGLLAGPQDKRDALDSFYLQYAVWAEADQNSLKDRFLAVMKDLEILFPSRFPIQATRFRQKADFYSLVLAIDALRKQGGTIDGTETKWATEDLRLLDHLIAPESESRDCRDYAIKCVSQANSASSRRWRMGFLKSILAGTYLRQPPSGDGAVLFFRMATDDAEQMAWPKQSACPQCHNKIEPEDESMVGWRKNAAVFQLSNSCLLHPACSKSGEWVAIGKIGGEGVLAFNEDVQQHGLF